MYEMVWQTCEDPLSMLRHLHGRATRRKLRLFITACIRELGHLLSDPRARKAYFVLEGVAEGELSPPDLGRAHEHARLVWSDLRYRDSFWRAGDFKVCCRMVDTTLALVTATDATSNRWLQAWRTASVLHGTRGEGPVEILCTRDQEWQQQNQRVQSLLLRDIFGNPFQKLTLDPDWLVGPGQMPRRMAAGIYAERAFEETPILGDALVDADCPHEDLIRHCHQPGPHGRGCWVLDALLGKS